MKSRIARALRPLQRITVRLAGKQLQAEPPIPDDTADILKKLGTKVGNSGLGIRYC